MKNSFLANFWLKSASNFFEGCKAISNLTNQVAPNSSRGGAEIGLQQKNWVSRVREVCEPYSSFSMFEPSHSAENHRDIRRIRRSN